MLRPRLIFQLNNSILRKSCPNTIIINRGCLNLSKIARFSTEIDRSDKTQQNHLENIYYGPMTRQIKSVKIFSLSTSAIGIACQPILYKQLETLNSIPVLAAACGILGFFTFVHPFLIHFISKKYVSSIEYDKTSESYIATIYSFFLRKKQITFNTKDIVVPDVPGMFTTFLVKDYPVFVDYKQFKDPYHYMKMMGYDKPINFDLKNLSVGDGKDDKDSH